MPESRPVIQGSTAIEDLLHAMHDASKFSDGAARAILEGALHRHNYAGREAPHRGDRCQCPYCRNEARL